MLGSGDLPPYDFVPGTMTATSVSAFNSSASLWGLGARVLYPPVRLLLGWVAELTAGAQLGAQQQLAGLQPTGLFTRFQQRLILVNNAFGLEYARPLPPNVVLVGPMLDHAFQPDLGVARREYERQLSEEDRQWMEWKEDGQEALPVVWVSMGTIAPLNQRQVTEMYAAFSAGAEAGRFRVLWKLDPSDFPFVPPAEARPSTNRLRIVNWVSSQLGVLAHPRAALFVSHCGINSVHESVYLSAPLLCIPILADQADMAARVEDAGVGDHLSKSSFNASSLTKALERLLEPQNAAAMKPNLNRARDALLLSGGVQRAADYIEFVARHGAQALLPVHVTHPWIARENVDVLLVYAVLALLTALFWRWLCCTLRPGKECVGARKKRGAQKEE